MTGASYQDCARPAEDSGPQQLRASRRGAGVALHASERLCPDTGELQVNDDRSLGEEGVLMDMATGAKKSRVRSGGSMQGVVVPSPGRNRDLNGSSMGRLAWIFVS